MAVKGSSKAQLVIKADHSVRSKVLAGVTAFLVILLVVGAFYLGLIKSDEAGSEKDFEWASLLMRVEDAEKKYNDLNNKVLIYEQDSIVNRQANELVRIENKRLREKITELEEAVAFYRSVMSPSKNVRGLRIARLDLNRTKDDRRFSYKFILTQVAENSRYVEGKVTFKVIGIQDGKVKSISHQQLISDQENNSIKFRFRYFQDIKGEISLPDKFIPERVEVIAESKGKGAVRLEESFNWLIEEV